MALEGKELLAAVKQLTAEGQNKSAVAKACGYVNVVAEGDKAGTEIPNVQAMQTALLAAAGFAFANPTRGNSGRGVVTKTKSKLLIIGNSYTRDFPPGTEFKVNIEDDGALVIEPLTPANASSNGKEAAKQPVAA